MTYQNTTGKPIYLDAAKEKVVEEGPEAAFLLVGAEGELDDETAARYGLAAAEPAEAPTEPPAEETPAPATTRRTVPRQ